MKICLALLALMAVTGTVQSCSYTPSTHTMCLSAKDCSAAGVIFCGPLPQATKDAILKYHNDYRQKVASGQETRGAPGPQPAGVNIKKLKWSDELAVVAQRLAEQQQFEHDQDGDRKTASFSSVGQNIGSSASSGTVEMNWQEMVKEWYDEVTKMDPSNLVFPTSSGTGHYTQVVWAETEYVGCGAYADNRNAKDYLTYVDKDGWTGAIFVCNYAESGNYMGDPVYLTASQTNCTTAGAPYNSLCA